ncbi:MAG: peroxyureidoacrylate/ureidoacrylate amidohydrolase RutB [Acidimicrobiales bacterium]
MSSPQVQLDDARPHAVCLDTAHTALIVVDMQNDFGAVGGMFHRGGLDISEIQAVVAPTARVIAAARRVGIPIVYLKMGFLPDLSDLGPDGTANRDRHLFFGVGQTIEAPDGTQGRVLIRDTWNTDIVTELQPAPQDIVVYKHRFSGFFETDLHDQLRGLGVTDLLFTGCTTSVCVESTIRDAMFRDYRCVVLDDCTAEPIGADTPRSNHEASLLVIETLFGWSSTSSTVIDALDRSADTVETTVASLSAH